MKSSAQYRADARAALTGHWLQAGAAGLIAAFFGASGTGYTPDRESAELIEQGDSPMVQTVLIILLAVLAARVFLILLTGGAAKLGLASYSLALADGRETRVGEVLPRRDRLGRGIVMTLIVGVRTFLWSLLLIIPGIVKGYAYILTPYLLAESPDMGICDAIAGSVRRMRGHKLRLFCLHLSFFGWQLLADGAMLFSFAALDAASWGVLTLPLLLLAVVGKLFLGAYRQTAEAAFVRELL